MWKVVVKSFHLIGDGLAWKVAIGSKVRIRLDPWLGSGQRHIIPMEIKEPKQEPRNLLQKDPVVIPLMDNPFGTPNPPPLLLIEDVPYQN